MLMAYICATPLAIDGAKIIMHYEATIVPTVLNVNFLLTATVYHGLFTNTVFQSVTYE